MREGDLQSDKLIVLFPVANYFQITNLLLFYFFLQGTCCCHEKRAVICSHGIFQCTMSMALEWVTDIENIIARWKVIISLARSLSLTLCMRGGKTFECWVELFFEVGLPLKSQLSPWAGDCEYICTCCIVAGCGAQLALVADIPDPSIISVWIP